MCRCEEKLKAEALFSCGSCRGMAIWLEVTPAICRTLALILSG